MTNHPSPLRYPGGKGKLAGFVGRLLQRNGLEDGHYVEAFAGGAGVGLALLFGELAAHIHVNDLDRAVFAFWYAALYHNEELCRRVFDARVSPAEWTKQRRVQARAESASLVDLGFSTFFLNRTNRSGIIGSAGMIGGKQQKGQWKIDARYNRRQLITRLERIAAYRDRISLYNIDAQEFLRTVLPELPQRSLVYLDPPYYVKGQQRLYANWYNGTDHANLAACLAGVSHRWLVTYDYCPQIRKLYRPFRKRRYQLNYSANTVSRGAEVMIFSHGLRVPKKLNL